MPYKLIIEENTLPSRINQLHGKHWSKRHKEKVFWDKLIFYTAGTNRPKTPLKKAKIILTRFSSKCPDYEGNVSSWKTIIDSLVNNGIIEDDNMNVIGMPDFRWEKCPQKKGKVRIEVYEVVV